MAAGKRIFPTLLNELTKLVAAVLRMRISFTINSILKVFTALMYLKVENIAGF
jgi:hypothetical protein